MGNILIMRENNVYWPIGSDKSEAQMEYIWWCKNIYCGKHTPDEEKEEFKKWLIENDYSVVSIIG